jgi:hypothetical protein
MKGVLVLIVTKSRAGRHISFAGSAEFAQLSLTAELVLAGLAAAGAGVLIRM